MRIDAIVGAALLLFGTYLAFWLRSATLRDRIEQPKHLLLQQAQRQSPDPDDGGTP
jgi:hypothetical protein